MNFDVVIRGGTLVDGTGAPARRADVGVVGDRIAAVGDLGVHEAAATVDASDRIVTPGFVDLHSHLDGQVGWDPLMSSSCWHGVTSVVMGNCGMTFAPVRPGDASVLAHMMESVEDIPARSILAGLDWEWESFADYLNVVDRLPKGINCGGYVGDVALRTYVCGDAACDEDFVASADQLAAMAAEVDAALQAGALGYSISRSLSHRIPDGRFVPGTWANPEEFFAIAEPLRLRRQGVLECAPRYNEQDGSTSRVAEEMDWIAKLSAATGRSFTFNLMQMRSLGNHYREVLDLSQKANEKGARLRPQTTPRGIGILFSLAANSLLDNLPSFADAKGLGLDGRLAAIRDAETRARLVDEGRTQAIEPFTRMFLMMPERGAEYHYTPDQSMAAVAQDRAQHPIEYYLDEMDRTSGTAVVNWPVLNEDFGAIAELLSSPITIMGLADAGAHATQIMDASQPTFFLSHWVRDTGVLSLEDGVRRLSGDTASFIGYTDRGIVKEGAFADLNVIDFDNLALPLPEIVHDFPEAAPRFVQRAAGIDYTIVNGEVFMDHGSHTGSLTGRLLRSVPD